MAIGMAAGYAKNWSDGTAYMNTASPYIQPTTVICAKCHQVTGIKAINTAHARSGDHDGQTLGKCIICHSKTPHAWKRPRLIGYTTDPAPYQSLGLTGITDQSYTGPTGWVKGNCTATYSGCTTHGTLTGTKWP